jgi:hypothetical protein
MREKERAMVSEATGGVTGDGVLAGAESFTILVGRTSNTHVGPSSTCGWQCVQPQWHLGPRLGRHTDDHLDLRRALWSLRLHAVEL